MAMTQDFIVIGVYSTHEQARAAIEDLRSQGFSDEELGYVSRVDSQAPSVDEVGASAATGAVEGGVLGGLLGAAAALFIPGFGLAIAGGIALTIGSIALGATAGGALGALTSLGLSQDDARFYKQALERNKTLVTVKTYHDQEVALAILQRNGAEDAIRQFTAFNAPPALRQHSDETP